MSSRLKILLVEDDPGDTRMLQEILAADLATQYELVHVLRLNDALERFEKHSFDLVILDLSLPDAHGLYTLERMHKRAPSAPIIVLSGWDDEQTIFRAVEKGAQDYLIKGQLNSNLLVRAIRYAIERKRTEVKLQQLLAELRKSQAQLVHSEKMNAIGLMVAGVAHELNNPMMGILNYAQYCLKHTAIDDRKFPILQYIEHETQRCVKIVQDLLTFSRIENGGKGSLQQENCTILLNRVLRLLDYRIREEGILVTKQISEDTPKIWMKVNKLQQVFLNLINNALDALKESKRKEVHIEIYRQGEWVHITITDTGRGIPPEKRQKIFDPFFTTKPVGQGTGLGLSICQGIINEHNGEILCESQPGGETTFKISLPVDNRRSL